ncbi:MAG: hypothetical protein U0746_11535 [Gemmataceae bacterium]
MRRPPYYWLALALASAAGCTNNRAELVEAELRTRDRQLRELRMELMRSETMNQALENTVREQRSVQPVMRPGGPLALVKDVQLGRGTGGLDDDKSPGDEALQVVLVPRDCDETAIKAPGSLRVAAFEITPEGLKVPLSSWDVSAAQVRKSWRNGFLATGYFVTLGWQTVPRTEKLRIVAQFFPLEGGVFEAEKDVTVHIPPHLTGPTVPPSATSPTPATAPAPVLPMPRQEVTAPPPSLGPALAPPEPISADRWHPVPPSAELGVPR